jgi:restriction system protein
MEIPKFHETFLPILDILSNGETMHTRDLYQNVIDKYYNDLTEEQLKEKTKTGDLLVINRIAWGKSYLKKGDFIEYPERGYVRITQKGLQQRNQLTLKDVVEEKSLLEFYQEENPKNLPTQKIEKDLKTSSPQDLIDEGFKLIENEVKNDLLQKLKAIDPYYFEKVSR